MMSWELKALARRAVAEKIGEAASALAWAMQHVPKSVDRIETASKDLEDWKETLEWVSRQEP
jgi:hypothetical protein